MAEGDTVALYLTYIGTHKGKFRTSPRPHTPAGKSNGLRFRRVTDSKFVENWSVSDTDGLLESLVEMLE